MFNFNTSQLLPPIPAKSDVVTYTIKVNGNIISDQLEVTHIFVNRKFNRIPFALIRVLDLSLIHISEPTRPY